MIFYQFTALQPFIVPPKPAKINIMCLATYKKIMELKKSQVNGIVACLFIVLYVHINVTWGGLLTILYLIHGVNGLL